MINYKLCLGNEEIDLNLLGIKNYHTLESIDSFTSNFFDENDLKLYFIKKDLINNNKSKVNILYKYKKEKTLLPIYKSHLKYFNPENLSNTFFYLKDLMVSLSSDKVFLKKLINHYYNSNIQSINIAELNSYLCSDDCTELELRNIIENIVKCATISTNKDGEIIYNYRGIRDLGLFLYRYTNIKELNETKNSILSNGSEISSKNQKQLEYIQLSMFDKN